MLRVDVFIDVVSEESVLALSGLGLTAVSRYLTQTPPPP